MIDLGLEGKRAVVVGAGFIPARAGHGRGSALNLANAGATVACVDKDKGRADDIVAEITSFGGKAIPIIGDVLYPETASRVISASVEALGGIDVCVDVVGEAVFGPTGDYSNAEWDKQITLNLSQVFYVFKAAIGAMVRQGTGGAVVGIASVDGIGASTFHAAYGAAKAGVISLVKSYSDEVGRFGIRVNAVAPGNVGGSAWDKPDVPWGEDPVNSLSPPRPQDIANAVLFLCSSLSARITGQTIVVDGGATNRSPWGVRHDQLEAFMSTLPSSG